MSTVPSWILAKPLSVRSATDPSGRAWAIGFTAVYIVASLAYGLLSDAPWDDDCVVRYFNTQEMWRKPEHFFSVWNRPLFMVYFALTAPLGRTAMMVQMILTSAAAGWLLYRTLDRLQARNAFLVLPFFFFQTFYFSVSRNFLTEPLAVAVICVGLHALVHGRWTLFAVMGGLLPLARLELAVILPLWGLVLFGVGRWRTAIWLGVPVLLLMVTGYFVKDSNSLLWLVDDTLGREGKNRYGYRDVWHYFKRFAYVTGPVVFLFLSVGLLERLARWRVDLMVVVQGLGILALYVVFSWKLDVGNSAGFLRNLIPLAPFVAWLAYDGMQSWMHALSLDRTSLTPPVEAATTSRVERKDRKKQEKKVATNTGTKPWRVVRIHVFALLAVGILALYFSMRLEGHHKITTMPDHAPVQVAAGIALVGLIVLAILRKRPVGRALTGVLVVLTSATALGFTLISERPDAHLNPERKGLTVLSTLYKDSYLREWPLYANHAWFFWPYDLGYPDTTKYRTLTKAALDKAPVHAVALWENHYALRLQGDVQLADLYKRKDMVELCHLVGTDHRLVTGLFQKVDTVANDREALRQRFLEANPNSVYALFAQSTDLSRHGRYAEALAVAQRMVTLDSLYPESHLTLAQCLFDQKRYSEARTRFQHTLALDTSMYNLHYSIGLCQLREKQYAASISSLRTVLKRDKKLKPAYETLSYAYSEQQQYDSAITVLDQLVRLDPRNGGVWFLRGNAYYMAKQVDKALADYEQCLKLQPKNRLAQLNKAICLVNKGDRAKGCAIMTALSDAGDMQARGYAARLCAAAVAR